MSKSLRRSAVEKYALIGFETIAASSSEIGHSLTLHRV